MARCRRCASGESCLFEHGRLGAYTNHGCRCDMCMAAWREYQRDHKREYRGTAVGREKSKAASTRYYQKNRDSINAALREKRQASPEEVRARERACRNARLDEARAVARQYYQNNREKRLSWDRAYRERNGPTLRSRQRRRYWENWDEVRARDNARYRPSDRTQQQRYTEVERRRREKLARIPAPRAFEVWTADEDALAVREDLALVEICYMLGRSYNAVSNRRNHLRKEMAL